MPFERPYCYSSISSEKSIFDNHLYSFYALDILMEELTAHLDEDIRDLIAYERGRTVESESGRHVL